MPFMFEVGNTYKTQAGYEVTVLGRDDKHRSYECLICSDGKYRYDRSSHSVDAGRCTGTAHDYSCPDNLVRADRPSIFNEGNTMTTVNIFEQAARKKLRFPTIKNEVTVEALLDMNLDSRDGFDLDTVAKTVNAELKAVGEESFVKTSTNPKKAILELKLEIVKFVIADKLEEAARKKAASAKSAEKTMLLEALADQENAALKALSPEQIKARLAVLAADGV